MPIYEFRCLDCQNEFESIVLGRDESICCPNCKGKSLERLISACRFKSAASGGQDPLSSPAPSSACAGCSGGDCSSCH